MIPPDIRDTIDFVIRYYEDVHELNDAESEAIGLTAVKQWMDTLPAAPAPDWSKAPSWAMWWAVDANGDAFWYSHKPEANTRDWRSAHQCIRTTMPCPNWRTTLVARPTEDK